MCGRFVLFELDLRRLFWKAITHNDLHLYRVAPANDARNQTQSEIGANAESLPRRYQFSGGMGVSKVRLGVVL